MKSLLFGCLVIERIRLKMKLFFRFIQTSVFAVVITVTPSADKKPISNLLYGSNFEYVYEDDFIKWNKAITESSRNTISVLRFPGGSYSDDYFWLSGVGPLKFRKKSFYSNGKKKTFNLIGTHEIKSFTDSINAELFLTVNLKNGSAAEAGAWVSYCNRISPVVEKSRIQPFGLLQKDYHSKIDFSRVPADYFCTLREKNGFLQPLQVKYWEIGNEIYLDPDIPPEVYAGKVVDYSYVMKKNDPSILIGVSFNNFNLNWNDSMMRVAKEVFDFVCIHYYEGPGRSPLGVGFSSNGMVSKVVDLSESQETKLRFEAYGDSFLGYPILELQVDDKMFTNLPIKSERYAVYTINLGVLSEGKHRISFSFINDICLGKGKDRNISLRNVYISNGGGWKIFFDCHDEYSILFRSNVKVEKSLKQIKKYLTEFGFKGEIAITEGNVNYGLVGGFDGEQTKNAVKLKSALFVAGMLNSFIREEIWMFNYWNLYTPGYYGFFRPGGYRIPSYYVFDMYSRNFGKYLVDVHYVSPKLEDSNELKFLTENESVDALDIVGSLNAKGSKLFLMLINRSSISSFDAIINLTKFNVDLGKKVIVRTLVDSDGSGMEADNESNPYNVKILETSFISSTKQINFSIPAHTLVNLEISLLEN